VTFAPRKSTPGEALPGVDAYYDRWRCELCGTYKPIPQLARDCEQRHLDECDNDVERSA
jgi:hypothetical protein